MDLLALIGLLVVIYYLVYLIYPWFLDCDIKLALYEKFGKPISSLKGKVVWITGASSGIGEHLAYVLADANCKLILSARREAELEKVKTKCLQRNPDLDESDVEVLVLDICDFDMHERALNTVLEKFGKLDILVNNAGRSQRAKWENIDLQVDKEMFELNVLSQVSLSRLVAKYFFTVGKGHFVVTSSFAGLTGIPFSATYSGSKHALHGYFNSFKIEKLDKNIPITIVCPGPIQTNFLSQAFTEKQGEKYGEETKVSEKKVSANRCATLMAVAIANELEDAWIAHSLPLQILYLVQYYPNLGMWIIAKLGPRFLQKLRDDKSKLKQEE